MKRRVILFVSVLVLIIGGLFADQKEDLDKEFEELNNLQTEYVKKIDDLLQRAIDKDTREELLNAKKLLDMLFMDFKDKYNYMTELLDTGIKLSDWSYLSKYEYLKHAEQRYLDQVKEVIRIKNKIQN